VLSKKSLLSLKPWEDRGAVSGDVVVDEAMAAGEVVAAAVVVVEATWEEEGAVVVVVDLVRKTHGTQLPSLDVL